MGKKPDLTPRKVGQIRGLLENTTRNQRDISQRLKVSQTAVSLVKRRLDFQGTTSPRRKGRCGRKRKTTPQTDRWLVRHSIKNRRLSSRLLKQDLQQQGVFLHSATVRRRLYEAGVKGYRPQKKPHLTVRMKRQRLAWAKQFQNWTADDWSRVS